MQPQHEKHLTLTDPALHYQLDQHCYVAHGKVLLKYLDKVSLHTTLICVGQKKDNLDFLKG